jgi:predicted Zn-dependent protease with MMP-like domain
MVPGMKREQFRALVAEALDEIPPPFIHHLQNVEVVVEDEPGPELLRSLGLQPRRDELYGLYEGTPLAERGVDFSFALPDRIVIFYRPLLRSFHSPAALRREIRKTVIHEIGHFFGLDDDEIEREGF